MESATRVQTPSSPSSSSSSPRHAPPRRDPRAPRDPPARAAHDPPAHLARDPPARSARDPPARSTRPPPARAAHDPPDAHPRAPANRRILVSGYPNYTQPQDILEVFTKFGNVRLDKCNSYSSTLTYASEEEVKAAISANKRLHIYGYYLSVRLYSGRPDDRPPQPSTPKREFPMSKQKGVIIEPKKIDLSGDFHSQLDNILAAVRLTQEDVKSLSQLYSDIETALQAQWPGCKAVPFGSITTGLGIKSSDADCFVSVPPQFRSAAANYVGKAKRVLTASPRCFAEILAIPRASTPIVKLFHVPTATSCDVTFKTPLGAQNSRLVAFLLHADARLLPAAVLLKYWAKAHELSGTGKLTNYALTLMIIFYLQQARRVLPSVAALQRGCAPCEVDHWDTAFRSDAAALPPAPAASISELIGGFFEYYAMFNFDEMVICPYLGEPVKKELFKDTADLPDEFERYKNNVINNFVLPMRYQTAICVQDPFEQCHNVASTINSKLATDIKAYFKFGAKAYEKEKLNDCKDFLKIILLQRPKLVRGKSHPEYRVNLFPRIVNTIISFDWKSVVREQVLKIFENILNIKLGKVEEKVNPDTKKEKEKYSGTVSHAIWKRKSFVKLYSLLNVTFEEKEKLITQEIIKTDKQDVNIQFQLTLTYCHDPKSAVISIRLGAGDLEAFRDFGKFFISVMQNWMSVLLKPYSMPNCKDTAAKIAEIMEVDNNNDEPDTDDDEDDEVILAPKKQQAEEQPVTNDKEQKLNNEQAVNKCTTKPLTHDQQVMSTNNTEATLTNNSEVTATNCTQETMSNHAEQTQNAVVITNSAEICSKNTENFIKSAANNNDKTDSAGDVTVACALK